VEVLNIGRDLLIVLVAALAGGMLAKLLRLPVLLGYLAGGIAVGPFGFSLVHDLDSINSLAKIGVVLLLFAIGLDFSLKELLRLGRIAVLGGIAQIALTSAVGFVLGRAAGLSPTGALFFGFIISMSSTMIVLKILVERGELDTIHGRIMLGILLVQDLAVVPMMVVMPEIGKSGLELWASLGLALVEAISFIGAMLLLGYWGLPWFFKKVAGRATRELFLLTVIVLCLAAAFGSFYFGLSEAFGAFAAGLLISQSGFARQAFADILPLRDTFAALFFVSLGMLANLSFIGDNLVTVGVVVALIMALKFVICSAITRLFGYGQKTVLFVGTGLLGVGEFGFILALMGREMGILSERLYNLTVAAAIVTMLLTPLVMSLNSYIYLKLSQRGWFARWLAGRADPDWRVERLEISRHAVICGFGEVGSRIAAVLDKQKFAYLAIDLDPTVISDLRARGIPCIYGDASSPEILSHAALDKARVLLCTIPDYIAEELVARNALKINPKLDIVARVHRDRDIALLKSAGVSELVMPFFEASLEMIRHTLHRFGMTGTEIQYILNTLRQGQLEQPKE
jgi:CPA2 family monovalent cation:H+ antiporter-2